MNEASRYPHLSRAPILEALIDLRVEARAGMVLDELNPMHDALGGPGHYPEVISRRDARVTFGASLNMAEQAVGLMYRSADQRRVVQAQLGGFSFSRLPPYHDWDDLVAGARAAWNLYVGIARPVRVTRFAVRTINRMPLPMPVGDLREWLRTIPDLPTTVPQVVSELFSRIVLPMPDGQTRVILTQAVEPLPPGGTECVVIFDIDVFREGDFPTAGEAVWDGLSHLRGLKNTFFFECVTPRTLELFR
jgi:uncharacterized protein (TIGR04255 family)